VSELRDVQIYHMAPQRVRDMSNRQIVDTRGDNWRQFVRRWPYL